MRFLIGLVLASIASAQIYVEDYGAVGDGATDDYDEIVAAVAAAGEDALYFHPGKTYVMDPSRLRIDVSNRSIVATGAVLKNMYFAVSSGTLTWAGGTITQDGTTDNYNSPKFLISGGAGIRFDGLGCVNVTSYTCFQVSGADDVWINGAKIYQAGLNSITITAGNRIHISNLTMEGNSGASDDGIALVDGAADIQDVSISNVIAKNVYDILKIVNVTRTVRNVVVTGVTGTNVTTPLYIQTSGAVATQNITFSDGTFFDMDGTMAENLVRYNISGGAVVRNVKVHGVTFRGRTYNTNNYVVMLKNNQSTIDGLDIHGLRWDDRSDGVANGVGGATGYPALEGFHYETVTSGTASNIHLSDWFVNGTANYMVRVTSAITKFWIRDSYGKNLYKTNGAGTLISVTAGSVTEHNNTWER